MSKVLMSINPEHVNNIISGVKTYEFRKVKCKKEISSIIIYSTSPIKQIIGEVEVKSVIVGSPEFVWEKTQNGAGIDKLFFDHYFLNKEKAVAYCLGKVTMFKCAKKLKDYGINTAPQSFIYI